MGEKWTPEIALPFDSSGLCLPYYPDELAVVKEDGARQVIAVNRGPRDSENWCIYIQSDGTFALAAGTSLCSWCLSDFRATSDLNFFKETFCPLKCRICGFEQRNGNRAFGQTRDRDQYSLAEWQRLQALKNVTTLSFSNRTGHRLTLLSDDDHIVEPYSEHTMVLPPGRRRIYGSTSAGSATWVSNHLPCDLEGKHYHLVFEKKNGSLSNFLTYLGSLAAVVKFDRIEPYGKVSKATIKADPQSQSFETDWLNGDLIVDALKTPSIALLRILVKEMHMGDTFNNFGTAGSMGSGSTGTINNSTQVLNQIKGTLDLEALQEELEKLRLALSQRAETPDERKAVLTVVEAETDVRDKNGPAAVSKLALVGTWVLGVAKEIGTKLAVEIIEKSSGLG